MYNKVFHVSRTPPYGQWPIDTHKNIILSSGSSQIDGLEAGNFTFEDSNLIRWMSVVRKCVKTTFSHLIRRESSKVIWPASKASIWLLPPLRMMFLWMELGYYPYSGVLDTWNTLIYRVFRGYRIFVGAHYKDCIPSNIGDQWLIFFLIMGDFCT